MKCLPHSKTIQKWYKNVDGKPGITHQALEAIKVRCEEKRRAGKKLYFNLTIDEMSIKEKVEYHGNDCAGYVDLGTKAPVNDELPTAKYALVFMLVSINDNWKIPVGYYLINGLGSSERAELLKTMLTELHTVNANVISVTVDGAASNLAMFKNLGAILKPVDKLTEENISDYISNLKTYFSHPETKENVYVLLDPCHMIKLIRNCLGFQEILRDGQGREINWSYFIKLVDLEEHENLHLAVK